jgi:hypothetical protein
MMKNGPSMLAVEGTASNLKTMLEDVRSYDCWVTSQPLL